MGKENLKSPLKWGEGLLSKPKHLEPPSCSPVALPETNAELRDSNLESNNSVESEAKSEDEVEVVDTPPSSVNSITSIEEVHVATPQVEMESKDTSIELIEGDESSGSASTSSVSTSESTSSDSASVADSITTIEAGGLSGNEQSIAAIDGEQTSSSKGNVGNAASSDSDSRFCVRKFCQMDESDILFDSSDEAAVRKRNHDGINQPESSVDSSASSSEAMVPLTVSQAVINKLLLDSSDWANEESVLASIKKESLCNARYKSLAIQPKVLAHLLMKSQEVQFEKDKLALARFKAQEAMEKDYTLRLGKMYVEHKEKTVIQTAELNAKLKEVEDLKRTLEMRLKASQVLEAENSAINKNYEELVKENTRLQQNSRRMWEQLKAVQDGISVAAFNPAVAVSASGNDSAHSSASFVSVASTMRSDVGRCESLSPVGDGKKRDRSPGVKRSGDNKVTFSRR